MANLAADKTHSDKLQAAKTAHTPGPWKALQHPGGTYRERQHFCIHNEGNGQSESVIATCQANTCWDIPVEANARLIASAPELLKAVETALDFFYNPTSFNPLDVERQYEAAIQKARGGQ